MGTLDNMLKLKFKYLRELRTSANQPKSSGLRTPVMIEFKFKHLIELGVLTNPNHLVRGLMHDWI